MKHQGHVRCAIYTRKSSEEGLDQAFNSLDAQREACEAYIASQRHEGWNLLPAQYDDGGYSGGSLQRPALQTLLADIDSGDVDLVVVYKIDRLTRSLTDFAKMVDVFDRHGTSFVSVTQHFNTTTSMGRLTLNVLLSFAQFEREVTGERIRDKIAASKRKGMWMGGSVPLGYVTHERKLVVDHEGAARVRHFYERYRALGCVAKLKAELDSAGMHSNPRIGRGGRNHGGKPFSRGALYLLLKNRTYLGQTPHKGAFYPGQHDAIVPIDMWDAVQQQLEENREKRKIGTRAKTASLLAGMVVDREGRHLTPSHTAKAGRRYRYYLGRCPAEQSPGTQPLRSRRLCVPAHDLERLVTECWVKLLAASDLDMQLGVVAPTVGCQVRDAATQLAANWGSMTLPAQRRILLAVGMSVAVEPTQVRMAITPTQLQAGLLDESNFKTAASHDRTEHPLVLVIDATVIRLGGETRILEDDDRAHQQAMAPAHQTLLRGIAQGRLWHQQLISGKIHSVAAIAERDKVSESYVMRTMQCGWLAPSLVSSLIDGRASSRLTLANVRAGCPMDWATQCRQFG